MSEILACPPAPAVTPSAALPAGRLASSRLETSGPYLVADAEAYEADELARRPQRPTALAAFIGLYATVVAIILALAVLCAGGAALLLGTMGAARVIAFVLALFVGA